MAQPELTQILALLKRLGDTQEHLAAQVKAFRDTSLPCTRFHHTLFLGDRRR